MFEKLGFAELFAVFEIVRFRSLRKASEVRLVSFPGCGKNRFHVGIFGFPAQDFLGLCRIRDEGCRVAGAAAHDAEGNLLAGDLFRAADDVENARAGLRSQVDRQAFARSLQIFERHSVSAGEIVHMDVVADARSVRRVVIVSENENFLAFAGQSLHDDGDQVRRIFFEARDAALDIVARRVEVAERGKADSAELVIPTEKFFDGELRETVIVFGSRRMVFVDGHVLRGTVDRRGTGKYDVFDMVFRSRVQNVDGSVDVVHAVFFGIRHGFARRLERREMHEAFRAERLEKGVERFGIQDVALGEARFREKVPPQPGRKIVENVDFVPGVEKFPDRVGADVACAADYCDSHKTSDVPRKGTIQKYKMKPGVPEMKTALPDGVENFEAFVGGFQQFFLFGECALRLDEFCRIRVNRFRSQGRLQIRNFRFELFDCFGERLVFALFLVAALLFFLGAFFRFRLCRFRPRFRFPDPSLFRFGVIAESADVFVDIADAFEPDDFRGDVVQKIPVMADRDDRAVVFGEKVREKVECFHVQVVRRFVENEYVRRMRK